MAKPMYVSFEDSTYTESIEYFVRFHVVNAYNHQKLNISSITTKVNEIWMAPEPGDREWRDIFQKLSSKEQRENPHGKIEYEKVDEDNHKATLTIPPYIIEKDGKYYAFDEATLALSIKSEGLKFQGSGCIIKELNHYAVIENPPKILEEDYKHPFVYPSNSVWGKGALAYRAHDFEERSGFKFGEKFDILDEKSSIKIAHLLRTAQRLLERGFQVAQYFGIHYLKSLNCKIADNRAAAEQYAKEHGMPLERIIRND